MHDFLLQSLQSLICKTMYEDIFSTKINFRTNIKQLLQSNLSIVDMIYNRHLVILDNFLENKLNHGQTLAEKSLTYMADTCIAETIFRHRVKNSSQIYLFTADTPYFSVTK